MATLQQPLAGFSAATVADLSCRETQERLSRSAIPAIGVAYAHIVNAAFTHAQPTGSRFNSADRGAWYAAFELGTAQAEIAFHKAQELLEIGWREPEIFVFRDYLADFRADFHDIRDDGHYAACLDPNSYANSQKLASELVASGSAGTVYPSVPGVSKAPVSSVSGLRW
jgi:hypothetical protein